MHLLARGRMSGKDLDHYENSLDNKGDHGRGAGSVVAKCELSRSLKARREGSAS
jgi:hypothetical protein